MAREKDNFKAGLFVLAGLLSILLIVYLLTDFRNLVQKTQHVQVYYHLSDGLLGLKQGSIVTLGDQPVGRVVSIDDALSTPDAGPINTLGKPGSSHGSSPVVGKIVTISIPTVYQLHKNALIEVVAPPLGTGTKLNIRSVGTDALYAEGDTITGGIAGSPLTDNIVRNIGIQEQQRQEIRETIANVRILSKALVTRVEDLPTGQKAIPVQQTIANVERISGKLSDEIPQLIAELKTALADLKQSLTDIRTVVADVKGKMPEWSQQVDTSLADARDAVARVRKLLEEKDPDVRRFVDSARDTVENTKQITQDFREKKLAQIAEALDTAHKAMENFRTLSADARAVVASQRPVVERALANASLTSEQLKLAAIEIRRSPWRLMYRPAESELETDNLYDAARSYAQAASTLDTAAESLRAVAQQPTPDKAEVARVLEYLEKVFAKYQDAEGQFWKALNKQSGK